MTPEGALRYRIGGTVGVPRATPSGRDRGAGVKSVKTKATKRKPARGSDDEP